LASIWRRNMTLKEKETIKNTATLTEAHKEFNKGLNSHALFKTNDSQVGQDLVQDTFLKAWKYMVKGGEIIAMKSFLYHILNRLIIDDYRKKQTTSLDSMVENGFEPGADSSVDTHTTSSVEDFRRTINILDGKIAALLVLRLSPKYQKIITMRYMLDLSLKEISVITGATKNVIAVQINRGIEKLRVLYKR